LKLEKRHRAAVVELGINHPGEMGWLTGVARPDVAVVTNIGLSHIGNFGSRRSLAKEKFAIAKDLRAKGVLIVSMEDVEKVPSGTGRGVRKVTFGIGKGGVKASSIAPEGERTRFTVTAQGESVETWVPLPGTHNVKNAAAALAAAAALDGDVKTFAMRMRSFRPDAPMRLEMVRRGNVLFVNDAYNASPTSLPAALEAFRQIRVPGRKCAVLGDMLELGFFSNRAHEEALRSLLDEELDLWVLVGPRMGQAFRKAVPREWVESVDSRRAFHFRDAALAIPLLKERLGVGDAVLLKASRGMRLERIQEAF